MEHARAIANIIASVMDSYSDNPDFLTTAMQRAVEGYIDGMKKVRAAEADLPPPPAVAVTDLAKKLDRIGDQLEEFLRMARRGESA